MSTLDSVCDIDQLITVIPEDINRGSDNSLKAGDALSWNDAFHNMLMASSNTSANTVIRNLGVKLIESQQHTLPGFTQDPVSQGLAAMNAKAQSLGMVNSQFTNASGLDEFGMYTTARDMLAMGIAAIKYPVLTDAWSKTDYNIALEGDSPRELTITSTIRHLINDNAAVIGGKTGTLNDGTQNIIVHSKGNNETRFVTVLMQSGGDRDQEIVKILPALPTRSPVS